MFHRYPGLRLKATTRRMIETRTARRVSSSGGVEASRVDPTAAAILYSAVAVVKAGYGVEGKFMGHGCDHGLMLLVRASTWHHRK